jgi:hypothetical protein
MGGKRVGVLSYPMWGSILSVLGKRYFYEPYFDDRGALGRYRGDSRYSHCFILRCYQRYVNLPEKGVDASIAR